MKSVLLALIIVATLGSKSDVIGEAFSSVTKESDVPAVTYAYASVAGYTVDGPGWRQPQVVQELNIKRPIDGETAAAVVLPTSSQYYDGSANLRQSKVRCRLYISPSSCVLQPACGWCDSNASCLPGGPDGALLPCGAEMFYFGSLP